MIKIDVDKIILRDMKGNETVCQPQLKKTMELINGHCEFLIGIAKGGEIFHHLADMEVFLDMKVRDLPFSVVKFVFNVEEKEIFENVKHETIVVDWIPQIIRHEEGEYFTKLGLERSEALINVTYPYVPLQTKDKENGK